MKDLTPNGIALRISFLVAILVTLIVFVIEYFNTSINLFSIIFVFPSTFLVSYFGFRITIERFIYKKIKLIYRTIHNLKLEKGNNEKEINLNTDVLNQVKEEVEEWDKTNKDEIKRLQGIENYRRDFVGNVSHELKTPIFSIQGYLLTLLEGGLYDEKINISYLERASKSVDRMIALLDDLDQITKLETESIEMNFSKFDLVALINEVINSLEIQAKASNVSLIFAENPNKPIKVIADYTKINQVLINLIVNSIRYGKDGGTTNIKVFDIDENILIEVEDDGQGIGKEHLPRLFERFYRTDKGRARENGGTGLGLSIVKHILEAHDQTINVRSIVDVGSTFSFTLKKA